MHWKLTLDFTRNTLAALALLLLAAIPATASLIDFEPDTNGNLPDGSTAVDDMAILDQYLISHGVRFRIDDNLDGVPDNDGTGMLLAPRLEHIGPSVKDGFLNDTLNIADTAAAGFESQLGDWLLRTDTGTSTLFITYVTPTAAASGEIWDIDGYIQSLYESWDVQALQGGTVIDTIPSPVGTTLALDGKPWSFHFNHSNADIDAIRVVYTGTKTGVGVAFNNFLPVPEPSTLALLLAGLTLLGCRGGRRRGRSALRALPIALLYLCCGGITLDPPLPRPT